MNLARLIRTAPASRLSLVPLVLLASSLTLTVPGGLSQAFAADTVGDASPAPGFQDQLSQYQVSLTQAATLERQSNAEQARTIYLTLLGSVPSEGATAPVYKQAAQGLFRTNSTLILQARDRHDLAGMETYLQSSLTFAPNDAGLRASLAKVQMARQYAASQAAAAAAPVPLPTATASVSVTPAPTPVPVAPVADNSPAGLAAAREAIAKDKQMRQIAPTLDQAAQLETQGQWDKARQIYLAALTTLTPSPATAPVYTRAEQGLLRVNAQLIDQARAKGDLATAEMLLQNSIVYAPDDRSLKSTLDKVETARKNPQDTRAYVNPANTPALADKVDRVQALFAEAEQARKTGQYDVATSRLQSILEIDSTNEAARQQLGRISDEKEAYAMTAAETNRQRRLRETEEKWNIPVQVAATAQPTDANAGPITRSNDFKISQKLKAIIIPQLELSDATLQNAVDFLNDKVRQLDPDHVGVNFIPRPEAIRQAKPITLSLRNIPLGEAIRYVAQNGQVKYKVDQAAVFFVPLTESTESLISRDFTLPPGFFASASSSGGSAAAGGDTGGRRRSTASDAVAAASGSSQDVKDQLMDKGIDFSADGANATYLPAASVLRVRNTPAQIDLLEAIVNATSKQTLMVNIEAKFVEVNQNDLNDLSVDWSLTPSTGSTLKSPWVFTSMRGANGLNANNLDFLEKQAGAATSVAAAGLPTGVRNQAMFGGVMDWHKYLATLSALSQKTSTDLLSSPSLRAKTGSVSKIGISRTFFYPTRYDPPTALSISIPSGGNIEIPPPAVIPYVPTEFDHREIGVELAVTPTVGGDNRTIDLSFDTIRTTDFEGFINYGSAITIPDGTGTPQILSPNILLQPVFAIRNVQTKVALRDGYTVVLGGLIREDVQTINDKVPFLGDLPALGRFFQSKAKQSVKRNLLIFVNARIVRPDGEPLNPLDSAAPPATATAAR